MLDNGYQLNFHHFGLAVQEPSKAIKLLQGLGYSVGEKLYDECQNVNLIDCQHKNQPRVEIVFPAETPGPLEKVLQKGNSWVYHLCYESPSPRASILALEKDGFKCMEISGEKPAPLFSGRMVSFYYISGYGLIEILQSAG